MSKNTIKSQNSLKLLVDQSLDKVFDLLYQFANTPRFSESIAVIFGKDVNASDFQTAWTNREFKNLPPVEIRSASEINGANGAFSQDTGKIYLAAEFLSKNANNISDIVNVLLEEIGHFVDAQINTIDTVGDEGYIFSRLVQGDILSEQELAVLRTEDDTATVTLDGQVIKIEQNVQATSQFITLAQPTTTSTTILGHGSAQEDILQLQSYRTTTAGLVQRVWGYGGADTFNVNFQLPGDGKVGIDFNAGNLKALAQMLVEPDWGVREKRLAMDMSMAIAGSALDVATTIASNAASSIPFVGDTIATGIEVANIAAQLTLELGNIGGNYDLDIEEYNNSLAAINDFFSDQNNSNWGTVNILDARTVVEIRDFEPGIDIITLPELPINWVWKTGSGIFGDTGKNYVSVSFANGTNVSGEILRIGFEDNLSSQIIGNQEDLIKNLLVLSNSGFAIGDTIKQQKSTLGVYLEGTVANDVLSINPDNTNAVVTLSGGRGDDVLIGRVNGNDLLDGSFGNDYFAPGTGSDTINGGVGYDRVDYSNLTTGINITSSVFTSIEGVIGTIYNDIINLSSLTVTNSDNLVTGLISIKGNNGADRLIGSQYSDLLDGGVSNDTLIGGLGNDTYIVDTTDDTITENANEGTDTISSSFTFSLANQPNIENLTLTGTAAINGTGNAANNIIKGNDANNTLNGAAGNDTLTGGSGSDTLIGGLGNDTYIVDTTTDTIIENAAEGTDTIESSVTFSLANQANIENLTLTGTAAINGTGNTANNIIKGNDDDNTLDGAAGIDTLIGGLGNDTYIVNTTTDTITENAAEGTDTISTSVTFSLANRANIENLTLTGTAAINGTGNAANNVITGNNANNTLDGAAGNDTLIGGLGNDTYMVDTTTDTITENAGEGTDTVSTSVTFSLANRANIENLTLRGTAAIDGTGNAANNVITGNSANNTLYGDVGNDTLTGGAGNDRLIGDTNTNSSFTLGLVTNSVGSYKDNTKYLSADVNKDGAADLIEIWQNGTQYNSTSWINNGQGAFSLGTVSNIGNYANNTKFLSADVNKDGAADLIEVWQSGTQYNSTSWINNGQGAFSLGTVSNIGNYANNTKYLSADLNQDGAADLIEIWQNGTQYNSTSWINNGQGAFSLGPVTNLGSFANNTKHLSADVNKDGAADLIELWQFGDRYIVSTWTNNGQGSFSLQGQLIQNIGYYRDNTQYLSTDVNKDGAADLIAIEQSGNKYNATTWLKEVFSYFFPSPVTNNIGDYRANTQYLSADVNKDGAADLIELWQNGNQYASATWNSNTGNDRLNGGIGKDTLTGGLGIDRFDYRLLTDSLLDNFDVITDFNANSGNDLLLVPVARSGFSNVGSVTTLDTSGIAAQLTSTNFGANSAAQFTFGNRTFVAINDATSGFDANTDAIIEVTGLTGTVGINNFTTA